MSLDWMENLPKPGPDDCRRCYGCGQVAGDDDGESPLSVWEAMPPESAIALHMGIIQPRTCPDCDGSGKPPTPPKGV